MRPDEIIKVSERVEIEITTKGEYFGNYLSRIEDIEDKKKINIGLPIEKGTIVPLRVGEGVNINITRKDGVYTFSGSILKRELKPYPYFTINYPKDIKRLQRRNYVRIPLNLMVVFKLNITKVDEKGQKIEQPEEKGVTLNLSGGGMYLLSTKEFNLGDKLIVNFALPNGIKCVGINSTIKRKEKVGEKEKERLAYGVSFDELSEKIRDSIISYLFELQRERQSKGINF